MNEIHGLYGNEYEITWTVLHLTLNTCNLSLVVHSSYDSGSPIIIPGRHHDLLVGLVSWGEACGDPEFPAVNSRVSFVSQWIDETVCELSDNPPADFCGRNKWHFPSLSSSPTTMISLVIIMGAIGVVLLRKSKHHKNRKPTIEEQESLCSYSSSSSEDYQAVEFT